MKQRLQKILSQAGIASRRAAEELILEGRVEVDGEVVRTLGASADPELQDVRVDGSRVRTSRRRRYLALHKPPGYVTTRSDPGRRPTVMSLLPARFQSLFPVGRLDMATSGLLILTDDGELAQRLTHPRYGVTKTYLATALGEISAGTLTRAMRGILVDGERLFVDSARILTVRQGRESKKMKTRFRVSLRQGRNREIRRLFGALGHTVVELHRERVGPLSLRGLERGSYRALEPDEVRSLGESSAARPARRTRGK